MGISLGLRKTACGVYVGFTYGCFILRADGRG